MRGVYKLEFRLDKNGRFICYYEKFMKTLKKFENSIAKRKKVWYNIKCNIRGLNTKPRINFYV